MTGLDVLQRLRSDGDRVGVIMITAARELDTVKGALDGGAADYLIKPFEFDQLKAKLEAFAARADALESAGGVDQSLIDSLFGGPRPARRRNCCRRGLAPRRASWCWMRSAVAGEVSAAECADSVGISRVSARRYLEHYLGTGAAGIAAAVWRRPARAALPLRRRVDRPRYPRLPLGAPVQG